MLCAGGCVATKQSSFPQSVLTVERLSKTYMTPSHNGWWYLWLCETFSVKCLLRSVSHIAGAQLMSTFFLLIWHACAQYTVPQLRLVIYFLRCLTWKSEHFYRKRRRRFIWLRCSDVPAFSGCDAVEESIEQCCTCIVSMWERDGLYISLSVCLCWCSFSQLEFLSLKCNTCRCVL